MSCPLSHNKSVKETGEFILILVFLDVRNFLKIACYVNWSYGNSWKNTNSSSFVFSLKVSTYLYNGNVRVIYDRVQNRKKYFEIPAFLPIEQGISRAGKFKVMLHFAETEMCLCFYLNFPLLKFLVRNSKRQQFQNNFSCSIPYDI